MNHTLINRTKCIIFLALLLASASVAFGQKNKPNPIQATFASSRLVHRVKYNDKWWMVVYVTFRVKNALSNPLRMTAYFYNESDGKPLRALATGKYRTAAGTVSADTEFTPPILDANYEEFKIYVPYEALNLDSKPGSLYNLKYFLSLRDEVDKQEIAKSGWFKFSLKY
jgi:hypothetical protein